MPEKNDQEKTEQPTSKKLSDARKKGQVAKSQEVASALILMGSLGVLLFAGAWMFWTLTKFMHGIFGNLGTLHVEGDSASAFLLTIFEQVLILIMPLMMVLLIVGIGANLIQVGFMFTGEPLIPKFSKFNPISGMKKLFSLKSLVELVKSLLKILLISGISYAVLMGEIDKIPSLIQMSVGQILVFMGTASLKIIFYVALGMLAMAVLDFIYQKWQFTKDMMMTKQEVKDERKQSEGDPQVKGKIKKAQKEMAMRRMMQAVPDADVIITNPTSLAVVLKYNAQEMVAPQVVAKGASFVADRIKAVGRENGVPIVENKPLAQVLYKTCEIDDTIPDSLYRAVAEILAYVYRLRQTGNI
ncbi:MAG: flagellar biosynthesis protein FlhB [Desulfatiglandaceae bacterium]